MLLIGISKPEQFFPINHELLIHTFINPQDVPYGEYWDEAGNCPVHLRPIETIFPLFKLLKNDFIREHYTTNKY
jgi:hypothetical protein